MGALLSRDLRDDVRQSIIIGRDKLAQIHDPILDKESLDCGVGVVDRKNLQRYKNIIVNGYQPVPLLSEAGKSIQTESDICNEIRNSQQRKEDMISAIITTLEEYNDIVEWLRDGGYCAFRDGKGRYKVNRNDKVGKKYNEGMCNSENGRFVTYIPGTPRDKPGREDQVSYDIDEPENREWKELVQRFESSFTNAWRYLRRSMEKLTVREYLRPTYLDTEETKLKKVLIELDTELQAFLQQVLVKNKLPRSRKEVYQTRLQNALDQARLSEQEDAGERLARKEYKRMRDTARAIHEAPGAGPDMVYETNHAES